MENKLESGLYCELVSRELLDGFVEYTLLYDMIANRIPISEVRVEHGKMRLMQNTYWAVSYTHLNAQYIRGKSV